jgi:uncharacterized protein YdaU (DUF1376 family)
MYPADFEADTSHLTLEEDGAYNRLLRLMWMTPGCSLPDDPAWIARRMRVTAEVYEKVIAPLMAEFFKRANGRVYSPRLRKEWEKVDETSRRRSEAGKKGGRPKAIENKQHEQKAGFDFDKAGPKQPEPEPDREKREANASQKKARGTRLSADWFLPMEWGEWALSQGLGREAIRSEADKFKDYWTARAGPNGVKLDWLATWRNWIRAAKEKGHGNGNRISGPTTGGKRVDPALEQIARLAGLGPAPGDGRGGVGGFGEEAGPLWMGTRPQ